MPPAVFDNLDINAAVLSLPSCSRCRSRRVKCDSLLPMCANCARCGHECTYRDHALNRVVSRPYLATLVARVAELRAFKETQRSTGTISTENQETTSACIPVYSRTNARRMDGAPEDGICFWGPSSFYAQLAKTLVSAPGLPQPLPVSPSPRTGGIIDCIPRLAPCYSVSSLLPKADLCLRLLRLYHESVETFYPVFGWDALADLVHDVYRDHPSRRTSPASARSTRTSYRQSSSIDGRSPVASASAESLLLLCLLLAATFRLLSLTDQRVVEHAKAHYACFQDLQNRHLSTPHSQQANNQVLQVQVAAVHCIYLLLGPPAPTTWQIIGHARTLYDELPAAVRMANSRLQRTLLCLDMQTAHAFGRPVVFVDTENEDRASTPPPAFLAELIFSMARIWSDLHSAAGASGPTAVLDRTWLMRVHADLQGWIYEWNNAISARLASLSTRQAEHFRTSGSLLQSQCIFDLFRLAAQIQDGEEPLATKAERQLAAARLINDTHRLYHEARSGTTVDTPNDASETVFPFFWTHAHALASACLFLLAERDNLSDGPLQKGLMLLLALDPSQTLFRALSNMQAPMQHSSTHAIAHDA